MTDAQNRLSTPSRRRILAGGVKLAGTAALLSAVRSAFPVGAFAQSAGPEITKAVFGYIALTDAAPLIMAKEKGYFAKHGLPDIEVAKQASWGATRDNLELGSAGNGIDGAHILSPLPYLMALGKVTKNAQPVPMYVLTRLNLNGQCISISKAYKDLNVGLDATALKAAWAKQAAAGKDVKCAMTFRGGTHDLWIRYWLAANGIDPDKAVSTIVVPPPQMVANMKVGAMDAFCVCEPWNLQLIHQDIGFTALTTGELWANHPEKAFAVRADWADKNPNAAKAAVTAIQEAAMWCDKPENASEMCQTIGKRAWFNVPVEDIEERVKGTFDYGTGRVVKDSPHIMKFWRDFASYPFQSHDKWFLAENIRWGNLPADLDMAAIIGKVNREDIWRAAAKDLGTAAADIPAGTSRGSEKMFDGKVFDPDQVQAYLASLAIKKA